MPNPPVTRNHGSCPRQILPPHVHVQVIVLKGAFEDGKGQEHERQQHKRTVDPDIAPPITRLVGRCTAPAIETIDEEHDRQVKHAGQHHCGRKTLPIRDDPIDRPRRSHALVDLVESRKGPTSPGGVAYPGNSPVSNPEPAGNQNAVKEENHCRAARSEGARKSRSPRERLVLDPVGLVGIGSQSLVPLQFVRLVIAIAPDNPAVSFKRENVGGNTVEEPAVVADHHREPPKSTTASSSARNISTSRSLVGSSSRSRLPPLLRSFAR